MKVTSLFICQPFILPGNVILALKNCDLAVRNIRNEDGRDRLPSTVIWRDGMQFQVAGRPTISLDDSPIWTHVNSFEKPTVIPNRLEEFGDPRKIQDQVPQIPLADSAVFLNPFNSMLNAGIGCVETNILQRQFSVLDRNCLSLDD